MESDLEQLGLQQTATDSSATRDINNYVEQRISFYIKLYYTPVCVIIGIIGNGMSFCVLVLTPMRKTTTCLYMASIAVLDIFVLLTAVNSYFISNVPSYDLEPWSCRVLSFLFYAVIHYDVLLLLAMTVERYVVVRFPLKAVSVITTKKTMLIILGLGLFSTAVNIHNVFTRTAVWDTQSKNYFCSGNTDQDIFFLEKVHPWIDATLYCFIPMTSLFVINILITLNLRRASKNHDQMLSTVLNQSQGQRQVTVMLILVSFAFLFLSAPIALMLIIERYGWIRVTVHDQAKYNLARVVANNLMYSNHMVNFVLYCISGKKFRTHLQNLFCRRRLRSGQSQVSVILDRSQQEVGNFRHLEFLRDDK